MPKALQDPSFTRQRHRSTCPNTEQILVWAVRRWHLYGAVSREIELGFLALCGIAEVEYGLAAFDRLMAALARHGRRKMTIGGIKGAFSLDERAVLTLLAVCQHGRSDHRRALLCWLVPQQAADTVSTNAGTLAGILSRAGQVLPEPRDC